MNIQNIHNLVQSIVRSLLETGIIKPNQTGDTYSAVRSALSSPGSTEALLEVFESKINSKLEDLRAQVMANSRELERLSEGEDQDDSGEKNWWTGPLLKLGWEFKEVNDGWYKYSRSVHRGEWIHCFIKDRGIEIIDIRVCIQTVNSTECSNVRITSPSGFMGIYNECLQQARRRIEKA